MSALSLKAPPSINLILRPGCNSFHAYETRRKKGEYPEATQRTVDEETKAIVPIATIYRQECLRWSFDLKTHELEFATMSSASKAPITIEDASEESKTAEGYSLDFCSLHSLTIRNYDFGFHFISQPYLFGCHL
ncbi:hypothetical protein TNCV_4643351 [Trichonephila clavipes]|nr:hypothetical protein TNCV_4643351 [Trichonephila clavipes]